MTSNANKNAAQQTSRRRTAATSGGSSQKLPQSTTTTTMTSSSSKQQQQQQQPIVPPCNNSNNNSIILHNNNKKNRRSGSGGFRTSTATVAFVACIISLLSLWFVFLAHVIRHRRDYNVRFFHGLQWRREHYNAASDNNNNNNNSNNPFCSFRKYPPHRYYDLELHNNKGEPQPAFLTTETEYIFGEWPVVLWPEEQPRDSHRSPPQKLCVDQSTWLPDKVKQSEFEIWPFADGTNPSILTVRRLQQMAPAVAAAILQHHPAAQFVVTLCMTNSQCAWRDDTEDPERWDLPDLQQSQPDTVRTVLQLLDGRHRVLAEATVHLRRDAPWGRRLRRPAEKNPRSPSGWHLPALDDARLFAHGARLMVSYREGPGFGYETQVLNPVHLEFVAFIDSSSTSRTMMKATIAASETTSFCCGRNMALLNLPAAAEGAQHDLHALTWVDPVTVVAVDTTPLVQQQQQQPRKKKAKRRLSTMASAVEQDKKVDDYSAKTHRALQERQPKKKPHKSHIHGTNAFMVPLPTNDSSNSNHEYLGVAHFHRPNDRKPNPYARFGHHYTHAFYRVALVDADENENDEKTNGASTWKLTGLSPEFVLPSAAAEGHRGDAEMIQFVSGLELVVDDNNNDNSSGGPTIVLAYGINDCEAALTTLDLATVLGMLRDVNNKDGDGAGGAGVVQQQQQQQQVVDFMKPLQQQSQQLQPGKVTA